MLAALTLVCGLAAVASARHSRPARRADGLAETLDDLTLGQLGQFADEIQQLSASLGISLKAAKHHIDAVNSPLRNTVSTAANTTAATEHSKRQSGGIQIVSSCNQPGIWSFSFDDGPYTMTSDLLSQFSGIGTGSFFFNGLNWDCIYSHVDDIKNAHAQGWHLGQHTNHHKDLTTLSWDELHDEFWQVELAFTRILGVIPRHFRPPFGSYNDQVLAVAEARGYTHLFMWSQDSGDSATPTPSAQQEIDAFNGWIAEGSSNPGEMVLTHSTYDQTVHQVVPAVLPSVQSAGFRVEPLPACIGISDSSSWYTQVQAPGTPDGSWTCS